jgi:hypothetical protein
MNDKELRKLNTKSDKLKSGEVTLTLARITRERKICAIMAKFVNAAAEVLKEISDEEAIRQVFKGNLNYVNVTDIVDGALKEVRFHIEMYIVSINFDTPYDVDTRLRHFKEQLLHDIKENIAISEIIV